MENLDSYRCPELIEKNRKILNDRLNIEIRQTGNKIFGLFYDMLNGWNIKKTKNFIETLKQDNAKPTRIKRWEFHYRHLDSIQKNILKLLKQFFDDNFVDLVSDPNIWWLYFNQWLKDIFWFDFIFWYVPYNSITYDDVKTYTARFFLNAWNKNTPSSKQKEKTSQWRVYLAKWHKLLKMDNYQQHKPTLLDSAKSCAQTYSQKYNIDINDLKQYKALLQSYFIYILKKSLNDNNFILSSKDPKNTDILKTYIQDLIVYFKESIWIELDLKINLVVKKFFKNTHSDDILPLEFTYANTSLDDISDRQDYFDETYFMSQNTSCKKIYFNIMQEFNNQWDNIKASHAIMSPDYFILKDQKAKLESDLYVLENWQNIDIQIQNIADSIRQDLSIIMTQLDKHFYSKVEKSNDKWKWDSMEKITNKYLKYYKIPVQYWRNFFIIINYYNHYYNIKSNIKKKVESHNKHLESMFNANPDNYDMSLYFVKQYINQDQLNQEIQKKREHNYENKINQIKKKLLPSHPKSSKPINLNQEKTNWSQLTLDL